MPVLRFMSGSKAPAVTRTSHLLSGSLILIIKTEIRAIVIRPADKPHFIFIQINLAIIAIICLIKNIMYAVIAVAFAFQ